MAEPAVIRKRGAAALTLVALMALTASLVGCGSGSNADVGQATDDTTSIPTTVPITEPEPEPIGPAGCGLEVNECGSGTNPSPEDVGPAECTAESFQEAVRSNIDGGSFLIVDPHCDGTWATFIVDRSRDSCPANDGAPTPGCEPGTRTDLTYWQSTGGHWRILTFSETGGCADVRAVAPDFPEEICGPTAG